MHLTSRQLDSLAQDVDDLHNEGMKTFAEETADLHLDASRAARRRLLAGTGLGGVAVLAAPLLLPRGLSRGSPRKASTTRRSPDTPRASSSRPSPPTVPRHQR